MNNILFPLLPLVNLLVQMDFPSGFLNKYLSTVLESVNICQLSSLTMLWIMVYLYENLSLLVNTDNLLEIFIFYWNTHGLGTCLPCFQMEEDWSVATYLVSFLSWVSLQDVAIYLHPVKHKFPKVLFTVEISSLIST